MEGSWLCCDSRAQRINSSRFFRSGINFREQLLRRQMGSRSAGQWVRLSEAVGPPSFVTVRVATVWRLYLWVVQEDHTSACCGKSVLGSPQIRVVAAVRIMDLPTQTEGTPEASL